jgi:hypothetical protein
MVIQQPPQLVALTAPMSSTGVFELDTQGDLLYPFEGSGVDTNWLLELPPAGNPFDFDSLVEVVLSIDYTAQLSVDLRDRVVKKLPRDINADRTFSIRRDFPDVWYDICNTTRNSDPNSTDFVNIVVPLSSAQFPPGLKALSIAQVSVSMRSTDGLPIEFSAALTTGAAAPTTMPTAQASSVGGLASSRQTGGRNVWGGAIESAKSLATARNWIFSIAAQSGSPADASPLELLRAGLVDDILVTFSFIGTRPSW